MPNMDDPEVLALVLCLIEAQGDKFAQLTERPMDSLSYSNIEKCFANSKFVHKGSDFRASWAVVFTGLETRFKPSMLYTGDRDVAGEDDFEKHGNRGNKTGFELQNNVVPHQKIDDSTYNNFLSSY